MSFAGSYVMYHWDFLICDNVLEPLRCILGLDCILANRLQLTISEV